ncbi:MAG: hypothetical protein JO019_04165 [Candidatus Kaiserbacteria bacterium]|nr:hypothetical protein [Candidatus Kaiserbacteria bacterium]
MNYLSRVSLSAALIAFAALLFPLVASADSVQGRTDGVINNVVYGWAVDYTSPSQTLQVHVYANGPYGTGTFLGAVTANVNRPGLGAALPGIGNGNDNHGYQFTLPSWLHDGQAHSIYTYTIDPSAGGVDQIASPTTASAIATPNLLGSADWISQNVMSGWAANLADGSQTMQVNFYADGPQGSGTYLGTATANVNRPGLGAALNIGSGNDNHGFTYTLPGSLQNGHSHKIYAYVVYPYPGSGGPDKQINRTPQAMPMNITTGATSGNVQVQSTGYADTVYNNSTDKCLLNGSINGFDIPDSPATAFRTANSTVALIAGDGVANYRGTNSSTLNGFIAHDCNSVLVSAKDTNFADQQYYNWVVSTYTTDGTNVYALTHNEWYPTTVGDNHCGADAFVISTNIAKSTDGGAHFTFPSDYKVRVPANWSSSSPCAQGFQTVYGDSPGKIIHGGDGYYYAFYYHISPPPNSGNRGECIMRTQNLDAGSSWQVWTGSGWSGTLSVTDCGYLFDPNVSVYASDPFTSVTYNTYLGAYVAILDSASNTALSFSQDLIHWSTPVVFLTKPFTTTPDALNYTTLLDPTSTDANFSTSGQDPYLYFSLNRGGSDGLDRDLIKQQIHLTYTAPTATFTVNGQTNLTMNVGDPISVAWSSTNAVSATSYSTVDEDATQHPWIANQLSGSWSGNTTSSDGGHTYHVTYVVTDAVGHTTSASITVTVIGGHFTDLSVSPAAPGGETVTAPYTLMPANTRVVFINNTTGAQFSGYTSPAISGSGTLTISPIASLPSGNYYLRAQDGATGAYIAQSVSFHISSDGN